MKKIKWGLVPVVLLFNACSSPSAAGEDVPALIAEPTAESRAELQRLVSEALGGAEVTLAEDALTRQSFLVIERSPPRDLRQRPLQGRNLEPPVKFRLLLRDGRCWLERVGDGRRWELLETECIPASE